MSVAERSVNLESLDIAVAHWHVNSWGGAEYLVTKLADVLDCETIYTLGTPSPETPNPYGDVNFVNLIDSLSFSNLRRIQRRFDRVFEYSLWEDIDWREHGDPDIVITSGATSRAVITPDDTLHLNYCHSPPRWLFDLYHDRKTTLLGMLARPLIRHLRVRDSMVDSRVDGYFANSPIVARRIWKYYKRNATVLYPPVELNKYRFESDDGFYLHLGRLDKEKGVSEVVEAFLQTERRLVIAGDFGDLDSTTRESIEDARNIDYVGFVDPEKKSELLATCRALVFNGRREDYGIVLIEANASGKPVIARNEGFPGLFVNRLNGILHDGTSVDIVSAIDECENTNFDPSKIQQITKQFSLTDFENQLRDEISEQFETFRTDYEYTQSPE